MACEQWRTEWIGRLYDELEVGADTVLDTHLEECADCRGTLEQLVRSRRLLQFASPEVPEAPRALLVRAPSWRPAWAFAAGIAFAVVLFGAGAAAGSHFGRSAAGDATPPLDAEQTARAAWTPEREAHVRDLEAALGSLERRLAQIEQEPRNHAVEQADRQTRDPRFDQEFARLERRLARERERDLDYLLKAIAATELRTGSFMNQTREALQYLAFQQDPRVSEQ